MTNNQRILAELKWLAGHNTTEEAINLKAKTIAARHDLFIERARITLSIFSSAKLGKKR